MEPRWTRLAILSIALVAALTAGLAPGPAQAGGPSVPFFAFGDFKDGDALLGREWHIDEGDVKPAGKSGRFVVKHRTVDGFLRYGSLGDVAFGLDFGANVPLATQSGNIHGKLTFGDPLAPSAEASVAASSSLVGAGMLPDGRIVVLLQVIGTFTFNAGVQGHGTLNAIVSAILTPDGHIAGLVPSGVTIYTPGPATTITQLTLEGVWHQ